MNAVKKIISILFALAVVAAAVFAAANFSEMNVLAVQAQVFVMPSEGGLNIIRGGESTQFKEQIDISVGDTIQTPAGQTAVIQTGNNVIVRLAGESTLKFLAEDDGAAGFIFELDKGKAWINGSYTTANVNLVAGAAFLVSKMGVFDADYDGSKTTVRVFRNQVSVGLIMPGVKFMKAVRFSNSSFINSFLMAQGSQSVIFLDKVRSNADTLKKLLYSKMIKEFQYTLYDSKAIENDDWVTQNLNEDDKFTQKVAKDKLGQIKSRGLKIASLDSVGYQFQKIVESFSDVLTFPADKTRQNKIGRVFDQIGDAEYLLVYARNSEAVGRLDLFRELVASTIADSPNLKPSIITELRSSYAALAYVMPDDPLFYVKSAVSDVLSGLLDGTDEDLIEKFGLIRDYMNYAYRMADSNPVLARTALEDYSSRFIAFTAAEKNNLQRVKNLIAEENQVMDYLLRQFAIFYQDKYFGIKHSLETTWLSLLPEGSDKNEEKQTIISNKIDFLKDLQQFFLDEKVVLSDAIDVVSRLMSEIGDIEPNAELGINQIIALRLNDYDQFLRFLNEVKKGTLQGTTMKDKYDAFLLTQKGQTPPADITETIRELTGEKPVAVELTADQILAQIEKDFADAGITDLRLGQMTGAAQQYITVENASLENIIFSGRYDWNKKQMLDLLSGRSTVTTRAVNLSDLAGILVPEPIQTQVETQPVVIPQTQIVHPASQTQIVQPTQQTQAVSPSASKSELVAKILAIQKLKSNDVKVTEDGITVTNLQNGISFIDNAILISHPEVTFSFTYDSKAGEALDVILHTSAGDRPVDSLILLADLSKAVFQASQASAGLQNSTTQNP